MRLDSLTLIVLTLQIVGGCKRSQESAVASKPSDQAILQAPLCPPPPPPPADADDLRFSEADFTEAKFDSSYAYFENELSSELGKAEKASDLTEREGFWITYGNSLRHMKGYMLKQAAQLERARSPHDTALVTDSSTATFRFCRFLATVEAVD